MKAKILILDDDPEIHELIDFKLKNTSFQMMTAFTAEDAINKLSVERFDCLLIDIVLQSNRSSDMVVEYLRGSYNQYNKNIPLLVMSAHMNDEYARAICSKEPMILNTIKKPFPQTLSLEMLIEDTILASIFLKEDNQNLA